MAAVTPFQFRSYWRELRRGKPGRRFQARYENARRAKQGSGTMQRVLLIAVAVVLLVIGGFLAVFPGPAIPFFLLAGGLLATESRLIARFMDWCEVQLRRFLTWGKRHWRRLPKAARIGLLVMGAACSTTVAYMSYRLIRG